MLYVYYEYLNIYKICVITERKHTIDMVEQCVANAQIKKNP